MVLTKAYNQPNALANLVSGGHAVASMTTSQTFRPAMAVDQVARGRPGQALCVTGSVMAYVKIVPWWDHPTWGERARARQYGSQRTRPGVRPLGTGPPGVDAQLDDDG
jgi:hypothetical protein